MIDKEKVRETIFFTDNDEASYTALRTIYLPLLLKKVKAGKYDRKLAPKALEFWYQKFVRVNMKNPRKYGFDPALNVQERAMFTKHFVAELHEESLNKAIRLSKKKVGIPVSKRKLKK